MTIVVIRNIDENIGYARLKCRIEIRNVASVSFAKFVLILIVFLMTLEKIETLFF